MNEVTMEDLLKYVAPCSLLCYTCPAYKDGAISKLVNALKKKRTFLITYLIKRQQKIYFEGEKVNETVNTRFK
ncbi:MAG TPA: hypothetical protein DC000_03155 [Clostridiales bacterium]|nr:hypothetical protein [Clostridiales bacterium]